MATYNGKTVDEVRNLLVKAAHYYYNRNESLISDQEFDEMKDWLQDNYPDDPTLYTIGAPVDKASAWKKAKHKIAMASLNKVNTVEEFFAWCKKTGVDSYALSEKLDGISIEIEYENGLQKAITRGDGVEGEDITVNVVRMQGVKKELPIKWNGSLHGEIVLKETDFNRINEICKMQGKKQIKNLRNGAGGIARRHNGEFAEFCTVIFYNCTEKFETATDRFIFLQEDLGLESALILSDVTAKEIVAHHKNYEDAVRADLDYDIDGLVIEVNDLSIQEALGEQNHNPKGAIAFKFGSIKKETIVLGVIWQMGKSGRITPVAELQPVKLGGVTVSRASLHNIELFNSLGLSVGDRVIVSRRNDVIPYVESVVKHFSKALIPVCSKCPACHVDTYVAGKFLVCPNPNCFGKTVGNLKKWIKTLDINGIGDGIIDSLYEADLLVEPADFYTLKQEDIQHLEGFGKRSAEKIIKAINSKREIPLREFIGGLNIPNFGRRMTDLLIEDGCETLDDIIGTGLARLVSIKGIEEKTAISLIEGLNKKDHTISRLLEVITIQKPQKKEIKMATKTSEITGNSFIFTGKIESTDADGKRYTRSMLQDIVCDNGGKTPSSISKDTNYLVQADPSSQSTKTKKAISMGVEILSESDFFKMAGM